MPVKNILSCINVKPTMAEFWCLLGDIYFTGGKDSCKAYVSRFNEHGRNFNFGGVGK